MGEDRDTAQDRVTIQEAAKRLGVKEDAIRKRIQRGTLRHEKTQEGRVFVWVEPVRDAAQDAAQDAYQDTAKDELVAELRDQVRFLREELARKDAILLRMAESIPQLEAPSQEPRESHVSAVTDEQAEEAVRGPEGASERRSWWQRMFGG